MNRAQLEHAIRASSQITGADRVFVIGSQSILGTYDEDELPDIATFSDEVDIWVLGDDDSKRLSEKLLAIGEMSTFHDTHGFYIDGVSSTTATLPTGWDDRLVKFPAPSADGKKIAVGLCLEPHDLCVAKLVANREKDRSFVRALVQAGLIDPEILLERLGNTKPHTETLIVNGQEEDRVQDINHAWVYAQTLLDIGSSPRLKPGDS